MHVLSTRSHVVRKQEKQREARRQDTLSSGTVQTDAKRGEENSLILLETNCFKTVEGLLN
jgi:hypothetical protein